MRKIPDLFSVHRDKPKINLIICLPMLLPHEGFQGGKRLSSKHPAYRMSDSPLLFSSLLFILVPPCSFLLPSLSLYCFLVICSSLLSLSLSSFPTQLFSLLPNIPPSSYASGFHKVNKTQPKALSEDSDGLFPPSPSIFQYT